MYKIKKLNKYGEVFFYQHLSLPEFRAQLRELKSKSSFLAIGASYLDKPVGLIVAEILPNNRLAKIRSLFVTSAHRGQGVGTLLLTSLEKELVVRGCTKADFFYELDIIKKSISIKLAALFEKCHWSLINVDLIYSSNLKKIYQSAFIHKENLLPSDMQIFPWKEITTQEKLVIKQTEKENCWIEEGLNPFKYEKNFESLNSLGLRYRGVVVGWMLTERVAVDTISYNCMFVRKDLQKMGRGIALFIEAIKRQKEANIPNGIWFVNQKNNLMIRFVNKYIFPCLTSIKEERVYSKLLL
ncbi:GNAT family N-acetyltransferase [Moorena sp. SIO4G3]|uniref:GNAT family N-acetyltransferase n=1 Tax=Moorena sp. SIO4G3 TaxID=2607821 RepID=UPI00142ADD83|nr:GNAT family N-acetyltransferase [Moorena sp. SIO4G3]NEO79041.1 GNAT family N-acetyltransferase [Moorena sp. SIO4G3]